MYVERQLSFDFELENYKPEQHPLYRDCPVDPHSLEKYDLTIIKPEYPVIYFLWNGQNLAYIGKTTNLRARLYDHKYLKKDFDSFSFLRCDLKYEKLFVRVHKPRVNKYFKKKILKEL